MTRDVDCARVETNTLITKGLFRQSFFSLWKKNFFFDRPKKKVDRQCLLINIRQQIFRVSQGRRKNNNTVFHKLVEERDGKNIAKQTFPSPQKKQSLCTMIALGNIFTVLVKLFCELLNRNRECWEKGKFKFSLLFFYWSSLKGPGFNTRTKCDFFVVVWNVHFWNHSYSILFLLQTNFTTEVREKIFRWNWMKNWLF